MQFIFKLLITEAIFVIVGLSIVAGTDEDKLGFLGAAMFLTSVVALVATALWWVWFIS